MTFRIVPRTEYGLPAVVTNSNGTPRPPLNNEPIMTGHYTGNNIDYTDKVTTEVIKRIQEIFDETKPFEYNYVIGQENNDEIYEFAGEFQAAHSAGENTIAFGVLLLLGVGEEPTPLMIKKWQWLRETLQFAGKLALNCQQLMHFQMPGAATACPGNQVRQLWPEFLKPYYTEPVGPIEEEDEMVDGIYYPGDEIDHLTDVQFAAFSSGIVRHNTGPDAVLYAGAKRVPIKGTEHFNQLARAANHMSGAEIDLLPE